MGASRSAKKNSLQAEGSALTSPSPALHRTSSTTVSTYRKRLRSRSIADSVPLPAKRPALASSSTDPGLICTQGSSAFTPPKIPAVAMLSIRERVLRAFYPEKPMACAKEMEKKLAILRSPVPNKSVTEVNHTEKKAKPPEKIHKKEEVAQRKQELEEIRYRQVLDKKKKREERMKKVVEKQAALKMKEEEKKKKVIGRVDSRANQMWQRREKEAEERKRRMKERMAAAEARRKQEAETQRKKLRQLEDDKRMAAKLAEQRKEAEEEEKRMKRLEKQRHDTREKEMEAKRKLEEEETLKKKRVKLEQAKLHKVAMEVDLTNHKKGTKLQERLEKLMAEKRFTPGCVEGLGDSLAQQAPPTNLNQTFVKTAFCAEMDLATPLHASLSSAGLSASGGTEGGASYEMTPLAHDQLTQHTSNYDIADLSSEDPTDDEDYPRKTIPRWAQPAALHTAILQQKEALDQKKLDLHKIFPPEELLKDCNLSKIFKKSKKCFHQRSSSANWNSPLLRDKFPS